MCRSELDIFGSMANARPPTSRGALVLLAALAVVPWALSLACVNFRPVVTRPATLGEELISLEEARRSGLLTEDEFTARRAQTIEAWKKIGDAAIGGRP